MPVTTAKTRMRTPEVMTWPSTGSAMNEVPRQRAKGTRMKPFSVVSLNSMTARKSMIASTKKATSVTTQERAISMISLKFQNTSGKPERRWIWASSSSAPCYADFLRPGKLAQAGVQGADVLLAQIQRLSGFPEVFWNLSEIMLMALAWVVTLIAFFVLAIMLFLAVIEFKLTTLKGFILVPFALWRGTSFIAEPVLGQVITSGVRILVFAVVTGIGTQIFSQILPSSPTAELSLQDALTVLLASMTVGGLALYAPKIAAGIVSGAPQLGLGAAVAPAALVGGTLVLGGAGLGAAARAGAGAVASAATLGGGARTAYALGSAAAGSEALAGVGGGLAGVARAGVSAATAGLRTTGDRVADSVAEHFRTGERAGWTVTGGSAIGEAAEATGRADASHAPGWARQLRREQVLRGVERVAREGEAGGAGLKPTLRGEDK